MAYIQVLVPVTLQCTESLKHAVHLVSYTVPSPQPLASLKTTVNKLAYLPHLAQHLQSQSPTYKSHLDSVLVAILLKPLQNNKSSGKPAPIYLFPTVKPLLSLTRLHLIEHRSPSVDIHHHPFSSTTLSVLHPKQCQHHHNQCKQITSIRL